jgi:hypothetical protein
LCKDIIESLDKHDYVSCSCKEIAIDGGRNYFRCVAGTWSNFLRIADDGSEIEIKISEEKEDADTKNKVDETQDKEITKQELMQHLKDHLNYFEGLPSHVKHSFMTNQDMDSVLRLIYAILERKE